MRVLFLAIILPMIFFLLCAMGGAHASEPFMTFENAPLTREERLIMLQVKKHRQPQQQAFEIKVQGKCVHGCVRPLDGDLPAIEISSARTGMPSEFMDMPTSKRDMERYSGR